MIKKVQMVISRSCRETDVALEADFRRTNKVSVFCINVIQLVSSRNKESVHLSGGQVKISFYLSAKHFPPIFCYLFKHLTN